MEGLEHVAPEDEHRFLENMLQAEFAKRQHEDVAEFVTKHGEAMRRVINSHPELIEEFEDDPDSALEHFGEYLH